MSQLCPCGSLIDFEQCCRPFHRGKKNPPTAQALMRARYSAYVSGELEFIRYSHHSQTRKEMNIDDARAWSEESNWLGLAILNCEQGGVDDETGSVEFIANYEINHKKQRHHEVAHFRKEDGVWYFYDGKIIQETVVREAPKIGRNDPCSCGSGKKFKKCCGA
jgi:SEC-C motif domain protein